MTRIGLMSDTHGCLPEQVFSFFAGVDEIWHAGDIGHELVADRLEAFKPLRAVWGNIDGHPLRRRFPEVLHFKIEEVPVLMLHIGGYPPSYNPAARSLLDQHHPHLFVCGHSHILKVMPDAARQLLHLNPGACGREGWHQKATLMRFQVNGDHIEGLEVLEFEKKGKQQVLYS